MAKSYKETKGSRAISSVTSRRRVLPESDEEDTTAAVENWVKSTTRHITIDAQTSSTSRGGKRTRFSEVDYSLLFPSKDLILTPEFDEWLHNSPPADLEHTELEPDGQETMERDAGNGVVDEEEGFEDADVGIHDLADFVGKGSKMDKLARVCLKQPKRR